MAVIIKRGDPLKGCKQSAQIVEKIALMRDDLALYQARKEAASWLRGVWTVLNRDPKMTKAAACIMKAIKDQRQADSTNTE